MKCSAHKFGGASVHDASAIQRVAELLGQQLDDSERAVVVVSAMGKTTNALEEVWRADGERRKELWQACIDQHLSVARELDLSPHHCTELLHRMKACWDEAHQIEQESPHAQPTAASYDAFVAAGELGSTTLVEAWLNSCGIRATWWDVRNTLKTSGPHRFARVNESELVERGAGLRTTLDGMPGRHVVVTQGFIGRHMDGRTSTLGREGSDYSAALLAVAVGAEAVTIWKDVPGMMNADPKRHPDAVTVPKVDHSEALELSYYGASVIHPRTIKPLQVAGLPLWVKSFIHPDGPSTCIDSFPDLVPEVPMFIWRENQSWMEVHTSDGSFLAEDHLTELFGALDRASIHVRLMQQSATHFGLLTDHEPGISSKLQDELGRGFTVEHEHGLTLLTVRHGDASVLDALTENRHVRLEQRHHPTWRRVLE